MSNTEYSFFNSYGELLSLIIFLGIPNYLIDEFKNLLIIIVVTVSTCKIPKQYFKQLSIITIILPFSLN